MEAIKRLLIPCRDKLAINAVDLSAPKVLQMGVEAPQTGSMYELSLEQIVHGNPYEVLLEDKHLNTFMDIINAPYSFQYGGWSNSTPRFNSSYQYKYLHQV